MHVWYMLWLPINYYSHTWDWLQWYSWWQWANDQNGKTEKQEFKGSLMDCFDILKQQSSYFLKHTYIKHMQSRAFISERESLKNDSGDSSWFCRKLQYTNSECNSIILLGMKDYWVLICCVLAKKMVAIQLLLLQTICLITNMQC